MEDFMKEYKSLSHTKWDCKYHIVFIPKYRRKALYGKIKLELGRFFHELAKHKESQIVEGHLCIDHIHMCISIPPKYAVSNVVGYIKGKSAIMIARTLMGVKRNFTGQSFWARGYFVSTVGLDEVTIREYIRKQEKTDKEFDHLTIFDNEEDGEKQTSPSGDS
jgi:putative transposase